MTNADQYRARAADLLARSKRETDPIIRSEWQHLARSYLHLAEQADRNSRADIVYETPQQRPATGMQQEHQQQQQQQQQQPQKPLPDKK